MAIRSAIIVGAGVVGVTTAYALAKRGIAVTIIDAREAAGEGTSHSNGGQLSYLHTEALASDKILKDMPGLALGMNPAFRIKVSLDPDYIAWLLQFLRNCTADRFARNTRAGMEVALESRLEMLKLVQLYDLDFDYQVPGKMQLLYAPEAIRNVENAIRIKGVSPEEQRIVSYQEAQEIEPALAHVGKAPEAVMYAAGEALGDANKFTKHLLEKIISEFGTTARFNARVKAISFAGQGAEVSLESGEALSADLAVLCTGSDRKLMKSLGLNVPVIPMKGYSITAPHGPHTPRVSITDTSKRIVFTRLGDRFRMAGMADLGWGRNDVNAKRIATFIREAKASLPAAADFDQISETWAGNRPMSPDSVPRLGHPHKALAYNLGHGMLGWTMGMGTAERLARLVEAEAQ